MVIISTSAVATIIQAVSAALMSVEAARAGVAGANNAADVTSAANSAARYEWAPMTFPGVLVVCRSPARRPCRRRYWLQLQIKARVVQAAWSSRFGLLFCA